VRGDLLAGVTVAAYLVPQVMAYAQVAGLVWLRGMWAAEPSLVIYAALGSSRSLSLGPESTTALMAVAAGTVRLGFLADLLSRPVIVGYLAGVALIMIAGQLGAATGVPVAGEAFPAQVVSFAERIGGVRPATAAIAAAVLAFLVLVQWRWPRAPGPLLAVLLASGCVGAFARRGERISANRELLALGTANIAVSMLHGFPVSSSASRTAIGTATGSRTQLYSVTAVGVVVTVVVLARPLLAAFPHAALAAIVIYAAVRLIDVQAFRRLVAFRGPACRGRPAL
jgi:sulfate permease, SulP family